LCDSRRFGGLQCLSSTLQSSNLNRHHNQEELNPQTHVFHYRVHNSTPLFLTPSQINPVHAPNFAPFSTLRISQKIVHEFLFSVRAACPTHLFPLQLTTRTFGER
jgi:hypothetical protein